VYKPSKTIEFDRNGELLLYSVNNIRNSIVYLKYPYILYDLTMPLSWYLVFVNPFFWKWQVTYTFFYLTTGFAWLPHALYVTQLNKKIHQLHLLRGGKYLKITQQSALGDKFRSWINTNELHILTENYLEFGDKDN